MYQIGIERRSPVGADNRSRTDHLDLGKVAFCQLNYVRKLQRWRPMRVLPHLPGSMPDSEHRSCPARRHTGRQRFYNLPELLEIVPVPGYPGMGLMSFHQGYLYLPRPHALRVVSMSCFSSLLISCSLGYYRYCWVRMDSNHRAS